MGKGDKKTRKGKITMGSYGVTRPKKKNKTTAKSAAPKKAKATAPKTDKAAVKKAAPKKAAPKKAAKKGEE